MANIILSPVNFFFFLFPFQGVPCFIKSYDCFAYFSFCRDNYAFVTFFEYSSAAEAIESELLG